MYALRRGARFRTRLYCAHKRDVGGYAVVGRRQLSSTISDRDEERDSACENSSSWLKLITNPLQWWDNLSQKAGEKDFLWGNGFSMGEQLVALHHTGAYPHPPQPASLMRDFDVINCVAPRRTPRPRINSASSGNIGVMTKLREEGWFDEAVEIVDKMDRQGMEITSNVLLCLLQEAIKRKDLKQGRELHRLTKNHNLESDTFLGTFLIRLYSTCGLLGEAIKAFGKVPDPSVYTWSAMIAAHAKLGKGEDGLKVYHEMLQQSSLKPEENIFVAALEACAAIPSLDEGRGVHKCIMDHGLATNVNIGCALIGMYTKCGSFEEARKVFERLPKRELVVWNSMIASYAYFKRIPEALRLVQVLQQERLKPNDVTFVTILKACTGVGDLEHGKLIHAQISQSHYDNNLVVANALMDMYTRCGSLEGMRSVFHKLRHRDGETWIAVINGYIQHGYGLNAVQLIPEMEREAAGLSEAFVSLLKACCSMPTLDEAKRIHARVMGSVKLDPLVGSTLIEVYCKSNKLNEARGVFDKWTSKPLMMWNRMIGGYVRQRLGHDALVLLKQMLQEGIKPTEETFVCMLEACSGNTDLELGKQIHGHITDCSLQSNSVVGRALVNMYERCGSAEEAQQVSQILSNM